MKISLDNIERLPEVAAQFIKDFIEPARGNAVIAFHAPMGTGKTTFIAELIRALGGRDEVSSPTFSIVNVYDTEKAGTVYHLDCYRLEDEQEAFEAGIEEYFASGNLCLIEWPENIEPLLPPDALHVEIVRALRF